VRNEQSQAMNLAFLFCVYRPVPFGGKKNLAWQMRQRLGEGNLSTLNQSSFINLWRFPKRPVSQKNFLFS